MSRARILNLLPSFLIAIAFVAMLAWTWNGWPDPIVDFGRELYVPWQITQGKVLYRDIAYFNGPLSPYFNALLFRVLGVSLRTVVLANIAICIAMVLMIWRLFRIAGDRLSATIACLLFITPFMTTQYVAIGNYNWITPYSHELTHGIALSFAAMLVLVRYLIAPTAMRASIIGVLIGLVFLTKPEVFVAMGPIVSLAIANKRSKRGSVAFVIAALVPVLVSIGIFGLRRTLGGWPYVFDERITHLNFYRVSMGMDDARTNTVRAVIQLGAYLLALGPAVVIDWWMRKRPLGQNVRIAVAAGYLLTMTWILWWFDIGWHDAFRGLPLLLTLALIPFLRMNLRNPRAAIQGILCCFALMLTIKLLLATRLYHYGFALAMPALLVSATFFIGWIPRWLKLRKPATVQVAGIATAALVVFVYLQAYGRMYSFKPVVVAQGSADEFRSDAMGEIVNAVVDRLAPLPPNTTVAVVPQGVMINYLAGKTNPTPYFTLMPPEVLMFGDDAIAAAYEKSPPDVLVIIPADLREYGYNSFDEVAPRTSAFFKANYQPIETITPQHGLPSATILRRVTRSSTTRPQ